MNTQISMQEFVDISEKYFKKNEIRNIMEIGSMDGRDSLFLKRNFPNSNVFCIEGLPSNFDLYIKNLSDIIPINIVVSNYDGEIDYFEKNINGIHGIFDRGELYGSKTLKLKCNTIETICKNYNIDSIDIVKIDVEGASYQILKSMGKFLQTIKIIHIETETYPFFKNQVLEKEVFEFLNDNNFLMVSFASAAIDTNGNQNDSVWVNKNFIS